MVQFKNPTVKRFVIALLVAVLGAVVLVTVAEAQVLIRNPCTGMTPSDWQYWQYSCWAM